MYSILVRRKIKCNGTQPCELCTRANTDCTFNSAYTRGRAPCISPAPNVATGSHTMSVRDMITPSASPSIPAPHYWARPAVEVAPPASAVPDNDRQPGEAVPPTSACTATSSQYSPEPSHTDFEGQYVGPASGVSFVLRVQKRIYQAIKFSNSSSIFTFGDAPLHAPEFDPSFCMMLPRDDAQRLVDRYFDYAMPTYRFLHRPSIQEWFDEFYDTLGIMRDAHSPPAKVALLFMVLALARVYMPDNERPGPPNLRSVTFLNSSGGTADAPTQYTILSGSGTSSLQRDRLDTINKRTGALDPVLLSAYTISH